MLEKGGAAGCIDSGEQIQQYCHCLEEEIYKYVVDFDIDDIIPEYTNTFMRLVAILSLVLFHPGNSRSWQQSHQTLSHD